MTYDQFNPPILLKWPVHRICGISTLGLLLHGLHHITSPLHLSCPLVICSVQFVNSTIVALYCKTDSSLLRVFWFGQEYVHFNVEICLTTSMYSFCDLAVICQVSFSQFRPFSVIAMGIGSTPFTLL